MLKKIFLFSFVFVNTVLFSQNANTLLWRISGKSLKKPSYIFGTIHLKDKRVFNMDDSITHYIQSCESFACELHPDSLNALFFGFLNDADSISDSFKGSLDSKEYELLNKKLQKDLGLSLNQIKNKNFKNLKLLLNPAKSKADDYPTFLDGFLMAIAKRSDKTILGLESVKSHKTGINSLKTENEFKKELIDLTKETKSEEKYEDLVKLYLSEKIDKIQESMSLLSYEAQYDLLYNRNQIMAASIDSILKTTTLFATCGAAHLGGNTGVIQMLREKGYTLTPIISTKKSYLTVQNKSSNFNSWQVINNNSFGFNYKLPGVPVSYFKNAMQADMRMYIDIGMGSTYAILPVVISIDASDKKKIYDKFIEKLKESAFGDSFKSTSIPDYKGVEGVEVEYKVSENIKAKGRVFIENNILYTFAVTYTGNNYNKEELDYFFNSISFYKPAKGDVSNYSNNYWNIEVDFPSKPTEKKEYDNSGKHKIEILSVKSSDNINGIHYFLECTEAGRGKYYTDDSLLLNSINSRFKGNEHVVTVKDSLFYIDGNICQQTIAIFDDQSSVISWTALRGYKWYNLRAVMKKEVLLSKLYEPVFNSLKFKSFVNTGFKTVTCPFDSLLEVKLTNDFATNEDETEEFYVKDKNPLYESFDESTGITYYFYKNENSSYYYSVGDSLYWSKVEDRILRYNDTLLSKKKLNFKNVDAKEFVIKTKDKTYLTRHIVFGFGQFEYDFYAYIPERERTARIQFPFDNINYLGNRKKEFVADTTAFRKIIADFRSNDTTLKEKSETAFYTFKLTNRMLPQVMDVLNSNDLLIDTTDGLTYNFTNDLIEKLEDLESDSVFSFVKTKLKDAKTHKSSLPYYSHVLASIKTEESYKELNAFLMTQTDSINNYYSTLFKAKDSLQLAKILYPDLLKAFSIPNTENYALLNLTKALLDSGLIKYDVMVPYESIILERSSAYAKQKTVNDNIFESYYDDNYLALLNHSPNKEVIYDHFNQMSKSKNVWCTYYGVLYLLKNQQPVKKNLIENLLKNPYLRNYSFNDYKKINQLNAFPERFKNQQSLAEADIYTSTYDIDEAELSSSEFLKKKQISHKGKDAVFYLFKVSLNKGKNYYLGVAGPYYTDEELSVNGEETGIFYEIEYVKGVEDFYLVRYLNKDLN